MDITSSIDMLNDEDEKNRYTDILGKNQPTFDQIFEDRESRKRAVENFVPSSVYNDARDRASKFGELVSGNKKRMESLYKEISTFRDTLDQTAAGTPEEARSPFWSGQKIEDADTYINEIDEQFKTYNENKDDDGFFGFGGDAGERAKRALPLKSNWDGLKAKYRNLATERDELQKLADNAYAVRDEMTKRYLSYTDTQRRALQDVYDAVHNPGKESSSRLSSRSGLNYDPDALSAGMVSAARNSARRRAEVHKQSSYTAERKREYDMIRKLDEEGLRFTNNGYFAGFPMNVSKQEADVLAESTQDRDSAIQKFGEESVEVAEFSNTFNKALLDSRAARHEYMKAVASRDEKRIEEAKAGLTVANIQMREKVLQANDRDEFGKLLGRVQTQEELGILLNTADEISQSKKTNSFSSAFENALAQGWQSTKQTWSALRHATGLQSDEAFVKDQRDLAASQRLLSQPLRFDDVNNPFDAAHFVTEFGTTMVSQIAAQAATTGVATATATNMTGRILEKISKTPLARRIPLLRAATRMAGEALQTKTATVLGGSMGSITAMEYGGAYLEALSLVKNDKFPNGIDPLNAEAHMRLLQDDETLAQVRRAAWGRSAAIAAIESATMFVGGLAFRSLRKMGASGVVLPAMARGLADAGVGMTGEVGGMYVMHQTMGMDTPFATFTKNAKGEYELGGYVGENLEDVIMEGLGGPVVDIAQSTASKGLDFTAKSIGKANAMHKASFTDKNFHAQLEKMTRDVIEQEKGIVSSYRGAAKDIGEAQKGEYGTTGVIDTGRGKQYTYNTAKDNTSLMGMFIDRFGEKAMNDRQVKFLEDFFGKIEAAVGGKSEWRDMKIVFTSEMEGGKQQPAAYDQENNILFVNTQHKSNFGTVENIGQSVTTGKVLNEEMSLLSNIVHEVGHFSERHLQGDKSVKKMFENIDTKQKDKDGNNIGMFLAHLEYNIDEGETSRKVAMQSPEAFQKAREAFYARYESDERFANTTKSEWWAFQFSRVARDSTKNMDKGVMSTIKNFFQSLRQPYRDMVGDKGLSDKDVDTALKGIFGADYKYDPAFVNEADPTVPDQDPAELAQKSADLATPVKEPVAEAEEDADPIETAKKSADIAAPSEQKATETKKDEPDAFDKDQELALPEDKPRKQKAPKNKPVKKAKKKVGTKPEVSEAPVDENSEQYTKFNRRKNQPLKRILFSSKTSAEEKATAKKVLEKRASEGSRPAAKILQELEDRGVKVDQKTPAKERTVSDALKEGKKEFTTDELVAEIKKRQTEASQGTAKGETVEDTKKAPVKNMTYADLVAEKEATAKANEPAAVEKRDKLVTAIKKAEAAVTEGGKKKYTTKELIAKIEEIQKSEKKEYTTKELIAEVQRLKYERDYATRAYEKAEHVLGKKLGKNIPADNIVTRSEYFKVRDGVVVEVKDPKTGRTKTFDPKGKRQVLKYGGTPDPVLPESLQMELPLGARGTNTKTPEFKKWFKGSTVTDTKGEPLMLYHGTKANFTEFERSRGGEFGSGVYFSENIDSAKMFGSLKKGDSEVVTMPVYLSLKNPLITDDRNVPRGAGIKSLIKKGYDGVIGTTPNGQKQYVAFFPEQIKSAIANDGSFDTNDPNILSARGANTESKKADFKTSRRLMAVADEEVSENNKPLAARGKVNGAFYDRRVPEIKKLMREASSNPEPPANRKIVKVDVENSQRIADAFEAMEHRPDDPDVFRAYAALARESEKQYETMMKAGYTVEIFPEDAEPYANSPEMLDDLIDNKHMFIFGTESGFGETPITPEQRARDPMLQMSSYKDKNGTPMLMNDLFRAVHDFFGHGERSNSFGALGEENAWDAHSQMFSPDARRAMTTETRGQNSWVNFGPHIRRKDGTMPKKGDPDFIPLQDRPFAEQKVGLLPDDIVFQNFKPKQLEADAPDTPDSRGVKAEWVTPKPLGARAKMDWLSKVTAEHDASRIGTAKLGTKKNPKDTPNTSNILKDIVPRKTFEKQMVGLNKLKHLPLSIRRLRNPDKKYEALVEFFKDNLLAVHDKFPEKLRNRATHWYDGAREISEGLSRQFKNTSTEQAAGVIAALSPQKDWFQNVAQGKQLVEIWNNDKDTVLTEVLVRDTIESMVNRTSLSSSVTEGKSKEQKAELLKKAKAERRKILDSVIGKKISGISDEVRRAWAARLLAEKRYGRNYETLNPEGSTIGMAKNADGTLSNHGWGSADEIAKALSILENGSIKNISERLGEYHKVRNFFNNIIAPNSPYGDVTIDTHAVAAAHILPFSGKSLAVKQNFGSDISGAGSRGVSGVYYMYLDAYKRAAAEADGGIQPRQMQSITWEAIRLIYPAETKDSKLAELENIWNNSDDVGSTRSKLTSGKINSPVWDISGESGVLGARSSLVRKGTGSKANTGGSERSGLGRAPLNGLELDIKLDPTGFNERVLGARPSQAATNIAVVGKQMLSASKKAFLDDSLSFVERMSQVKEIVGDPIRTKMQDKMLPVRRLVETMEEVRGGTFDDKLQTYIKHENYHGRTGAELNNHSEDYEIPIQQAVAKNDVDVVALDDYLHLRHASERNEVGRKQSRVDTVTFRKNGRVVTKKFKGYNAEKNAKEFSTGFKVTWENTFKDGTVETKTKEFRKQSSAEAFAKRKIKRAQKPLWPRQGNIKLKKGRLQNHTITTSYDKPASSGYTDNVARVALSMNPQKLLTLAQNGEINAEQYEKLSKMMDAVNNSKNGKQGYEAVAKLVDKMNRNSLTRQYKSGLIGKKDYNRLIKAYKHYVPLRGFDEVSSYYDASNTPPEQLLMNSAMPISQGMSTLKNKFKSAIGLTEGVSVSNQLAYSFALARQGIIESQKNEVMRSFFDMVATAHKDPALKGMAKNFFSYDAVKTMEIFDKNTKKIRKQVDPSWKDDPNVIGMKINGQTVAMRLLPDRLDGTSSVARALKNLGVEKSGLLINSIKMGTRVMAGLRTTYNPAFTPVNFARDFFTATYGIAGLDSDFQKQIDRGEISVEELSALKSKAAKNLMNPNNLRLAFLGALQHQTGGRGLDSAKYIPGIKQLGEKARNNPKVLEWAEVFKDFSDNGGRINFFGFQDIQNIARDFTVNVEKFDPNNPKKMKEFIVGTKQLLEETSGAIENLTRAITYKSLVDGGISKQKAANIALNLTTNFTRKGEWTSALNGLYLFFNAGVQGSHKILSTAARSKRGRQFLGGAAILGFLNALLNRIFADEDEETGESAWDRVSPYSKTHNLHFFLPGMGELHAKIPTPYGINVATAAGTLLADTIWGKTKVGDAISTWSATAIESYSPIGGTSMASALTPTVLQPLTDLGLNKDYKGAPIYKENFFNKNLPDSSLYFSSTSESAKFVARTLNAITGGDEQRAGVIDVSPDTLEYWASYLTGGLGTFIGRSGDALYKTVAPGQPMPEINQLPVVRRFIGDRTHYFDSERFYNLIKHTSSSKGRIAAYRKAGDPRAPEVIRYEAPRARLYDIYTKSVQKQLSTLRRKLEYLERNKNISATTLKGEKERIREQRNRIMRKFLNQAEKMGVDDF